jgi:hypothetical protein
MFKGFWFAVLIMTAALYAQQPSPIKQPKPAPAVAPAKPPSAVKTVADVPTVPAEIQADFFRTKLLADEAQKDAETRAQDFKTAVTAAVSACGPGYTLSSDQKSARLVCVAKAPATPPQPVK